MANMWTRTGQPGLWFTAGAFSQCRIYGKFLALQIALDLALLYGGADVATLAANYAGVIGQTASEFGFTISGLAARDIASQGPAFSWLQALDAPISGALRGAVRDDGTLAPLNAAFQIGQGFIQPQPEATAIPIESAYSYFGYLPDEQMLRFDELFVDSKWGSGRLEGRAAISGITNGQIDEMYGQFRLSNLLLNPDEYATGLHQKAKAGLSRIKNQ